MNFKLKKKVLLPTDLIFSKKILFIFYIYLF